MGGADVHCRDSGVSDYLAEDDRHAIAIIRNIMECMPAREKAALSMHQAKPPLYDPKEIYGVVSGSSRPPMTCGN